MKHFSPDTARNNKNSVLLCSVILVALVLYIVCAAYLGLHTDICQLYRSSGQANVKYEKASERSMLFRAGLMVVLTVPAVAAVIASLLTRRRTQLSTPEKLSEKEDRSLQ